MDEFQKHPLVSIIVPAYTVGEYIDECISSLVNQSYENLEVIVIDDGSSDNTSAICEAHKDEKLRIIHKENGGLVSARKKGIELANGKYLGFVDGDDYVDVDFVKNLVEEIEKNGFDFVHEGFCEVVDGEIYRFNNGFNEKFVFEKDEERILFLEEYVFSSSSIRWLTSSIWSKLFRTDFIRYCYNAVPNVQSYGEDLICLIACLMRCHSFSVINRDDYRYRVRENSMSHLDNQKLFYKELELCNTIAQLEIVLNNQDLFEKVYIFLRDRIKSTWEKTVIYFYPDAEKVENKQIVIYGAGRVGTDYYRQLKKICKEIKIIDQKSSGVMNNILHPDELKNLSYDYILIALENENVVLSIKSKLEQMGVSDEKIIYSKPERR